MSIRRVFMGWSTPALPSTAEYLCTRYASDGVLNLQRTQAIYGWRGGVAELVNTIVGQLPNVAEEQLNCSYRSSQIVIDTVNTVSGRLAAHPVLSLYPAVVSAWSRRFETHTTVHSDLPGRCRLVTAPEANEDEEQALVTLRWAATEVARLHRAHPDRSIGILVRRNQAVARLIYALRHTHGITASEEGGNPLTDSVAVQLILSLLRLADHPEDTVARFHIAHSPLGHMVGFEHYDDSTAAHRVARDVRQRLMAMGYGRTTRKSRHFAACSHYRRRARSCRGVAMVIAHSSVSPTRAVLICNTSTCRYGYFGNAPLPSVRTMPLCMGLSIGSSSSVGAIRCWPLTCWISHPTHYRRETPQK